MRIVERFCHHFSERRLHGRFAEKMYGTHILGYRKMKNEKVTKTTRTTAVGLYCVQK